MKRFRKGTWAEMLALALTLLWGRSVEAQSAPAYIPVQGYLTDATDTPLNGSFAITFTLYQKSDPTDPSDQLFKETVQGVNVEKGYFSVYLGKDPALELSIFRKHPIVFLGVWVGGDAAEMRPLMQLATAPFAAFSQNAAFAESAGNASTVGGKALADLMPAAPAAGSIPWSAVAAPPANSIPWSAITGVPGFAPTSHKHAISDLMGVAAASHTHAWSEMNGALTCAAGSSIRAIDDNGTAVCETDDIGTITQGNGITVTGGSTANATVAIDNAVVALKTDVNTVKQRLGMPLPVFYKGFNSGAVSCNDWCADPAAGETGTCVAARRIDNSQYIACTTAPGPITNGLGCFCTNPWAEW